MQTDFFPKVFLSWWKRPWVSLLSNSCRDIFSRHCMCLAYAQPSDKYLEREWERPGGIEPTLLILQLHIMCTCDSFYILINFIVFLSIKLNIFNHAVSRNLLSNAITPTTACSWATERVFVFVLCNSHFTTAFWTFIKYLNLIILYAANEKKKIIIWAMFKHSNTTLFFSVCDY